jgi:membrane protein
MDFAGVRARFERSPAGEVVEELVRVELIDRALALASKLFVAVIPLAILLRSVSPGSDDFGEDLVERLGLTGLGASSTRTLFATGTEVRAGVSVIGILIVLYSVLSFTRALQRLYLMVWRLQPQLPDAFLRQLTWMLGFIAYTVVLAPLRTFEHNHNVPSLYGPSAIALGAVFWLWTPYVLLGKRIPWHRLIPTGFVTTVSITLYSVWTAVFLPDIFTKNAERYGLIGIAFGIVTWLFAYAGIVIASVVVGWVWDHRRQPAGEQEEKQQADEEGAVADGGGEGA